MVAPIAPSRSLREFIRAIEPRIHWRGKMSVDYFEVVMTADRLQFIAVTESLERGPVQDESKFCENSNGDDNCEWKETCRTAATMVEGRSSRA
jgi:hypothetical protein